MVSLSSSPPLSPQSPTPLRASSSTRPHHLISPTTSNPHPFSGSAKASLGSHPSFGRDQLRSKHFRSDPEKAAAAGYKSWVLPPPNKRDANLLAREEALEQHFFDSSDEAASSDWSAAAIQRSASTAASSLQNVIPSIGLGIDSSLAVGSSSASQSLPYGLAEAFNEPTSPSLGRKVKLKARTFSRTQTSSKDPFSAGAGSASNALNASPRGQRDTQRRRLTGSSPTKLSRDAQSSSFGPHSSDDSSDEGLPAWEQSVAKPSKLKSVDWSLVVERVFEDVDGYIELTKQGLTRIDPIIADLSKFVSITPLRGEDNSHKTASVSRNAFERTILQLYLTGNRLRMFSSALFELHNLVVLTIGNNDLEELPPAIGQLTNLRELNISQNRLRYLPAEIQKLRLTSFLHFPNPFEHPGADRKLTIRSAYGQQRKDEKVEDDDGADLPPLSNMGPPSLPLRSLSHSRLSSRNNFAMTGRAESLSSGNTSRIEAQATSEEQIARCLGNFNPERPKLPSLMETCLRVLLEAEEGGPEDGKILLEHYESGCLVNMNRSLNGSMIKSLEAARRSATKTWGRLRPTSKAQGTWCTGAKTNEMKDLRSARQSKKTKLTPSPPLGSYGLFAKDRDSVPAMMTDFLSPASGDDGEASNEWSGEEERPTSRRVINVEEQLDMGDDSRINPWFNRCPNPQHYVLSNNDVDPLHPFSKQQQREQQEQQKTGLSTSFDWPGSRIGGRIFSKASVTCLEWVSHVAGVSVAQVRLDEIAVSQKTKTPKYALGTNCIPLQWRGCGPRCLDFLLD
ncbi:hypothetical protein CBS101457_006341 [Exobasidium rhododendri]|nr:hypothetical protein CBS101457_006341 [Exobasidium rhododendri]